MHKAVKKEQLHFRYVRLVDSCTVAIDSLRLVSEANVKCHWRVRAKRNKEHREASRLALESMIGDPKIWTSQLPIVITITRIGCRRLDSDNLYSSAKSCRDGIADFLGVNDGDTRITWVMEQRKGSPKFYGVEISYQTRLSYAQKMLDEARACIGEASSSTGGVESTGATVHSLPFLAPALRQGDVDL
jgi:hypothetical protein